jgi:hypothetical protein
MTIHVVGAWLPLVKVTQPPGPKETKEVGKKTPSLVWEIARSIVAAIVKYRWQLAPGGLLLLAGVSHRDRYSSAIQLAIVSALFAVASIERRPGFHAAILDRKIKARSKKNGDRCRRGDRHFGDTRPQHVFPFSLRERRAVALGLAAVVAWIAVTTISMPGLVAFVLLVALVGFPSWLWLRSPHRGPLPKPSPRTAQILAAWTGVIADGGLRTLEPMRGSQVVMSSLVEVSGGGLAFTVELEGVHPLDAVSEACRKGIEVALSKPPISMPVNSVTLAAIIDEGGADRVRVTMSPTRHLQVETIPWQGPIIDTKTGLIPVGVDVGGDVIHSQIWDGEGTKPFIVSGATGKGKSVTTLLNIAPGVLDDSVGQLIIYVDGGRGASSTQLNRMSTMLATEPEHWDAAIQIASAILADRQRQMFAQGSSFWTFGKDPKRLITVVISEPARVRATLSEARSVMFGDFAKECRKTGMSWGQEPQNTRGDQMMGGIIARGQVAASGNVFIHSSGGTSATMTATDGLDKIDGIAAAVNALPDVAGMVVAASTGKLSSKLARNYLAETAPDNKIPGDLYVSDLLDQRIADGWKPPSFNDRELEIAASFGWTPQDGFGGATAKPLPELSTALPSKSAATKTQIYAALEAHPDGLTVQQISELTQISRATIDRHRAEMSDVVSVGKGVYRLAEFVLAETQDTNEEGEAA